MTLESAKKTPSDTAGSENIASDLDPDSNEAKLQTVGLNRDKEAFVELFQYFAPRIKSFLMKSGVKPDQADELAQETMLAVWAKAHMYNPAQANASTWIFTIARNKRIDAFRKMLRPEPDPNDPMFVGAVPEEPGITIDRIKEAKIMAEAIKKLPKEQAELIQMSYFEEKTHNRIAEETNLPLGTVKSRIRLALDRLRKNEDVLDIWPSEIQKI